MMGNAYAGLGDFMGQLGQNEDVDAQRAKAYMARGMNRGDIQDVTGGSFLGMDRDAYTNQYTEGVMDNVLSDLDRSWQQQNQQLGSQANAAGAFGGSRHGVQGALAASEANRNAGQMSNQLYNQAFDAASGLMGQDLNRGLQANMANQGMDYNVAQGNMLNNQFNAGARNTNSMFNAGQANQVGLQNAMNNLTGQGYGLQALQSMGNLGNMMGNFTQTQGQNLQGFGEQGMSAQGSAGNDRQAFNQAQLDQMYQDFINERDWTSNRFGQFMPLGFGAQGSSTQTGQQFGPSKFSQLAGGAAAASGFFPG